MLPGDCAGKPSLLPRAVQEMDAAVGVPMVVCRVIAEVHGLVPRGAIRYAAVQHSSTRSGTAPVSAAMPNCIEHPLPPTACRVESPVGYRIVCGLEKVEEGGGGVLRSGQYHNVCLRPARAIQ